MELCRSQQLISSQQLQSSSVCGGGGCVKDVFTDAPPVGFRFIPEEHHLIDYLTKKFAEPEAQFPLILEKNIYDDDDCHPKKLLESHGTEGVVYLFSPRYRKYPNGTRPVRTTKLGKWKNSTKELPVKDHKGVEIGKKSGLVFLPGPEDKAKNWCLNEYWIPKFQIPIKPKAERKDEPSKDEPIPDMLDRFAIYQLYLSNDPRRKGNKKTGTKPSSSNVKLPAKKVAQGSWRGLQKVKAAYNTQDRQLQEPSSSNVILPAKKLAQGDSRGLQKVEAVCNTQNRQLQHGMAQVGSAQVHHNHNELSYFHNHNEVSNNNKDMDEQFSQNCVFLMNSDHYSDRNFNTFPYPGSYVNDTRSFYNGSANGNISSNYNGLQGGGGGGYGGVFGRTTSGWSNNYIGGNYNGLQGGDSGGGFGRIESGYELPPFPDELVPNYNLYCNSVSNVYGDTASVQSHAPLQQEYQELPPY